MLAVLVLKSGTCAIDSALPNRSYLNVCRSLLFVAHLLTSLWLS